MEGEGGPNERLTRLMEEFERRQRKRPDLVVRPWWSGPAPVPGRNGSGVGHAGADLERPVDGFVVEYCPHGQRSAELAVRSDRARAEGPGGTVHASLDLENGWELDGQDRTCPETLVNYLIRMADRVLDESA